MISYREINCKLVIFEISDDHCIFLAKDKRENGGLGCGEKGVPKQLSWVTLGEAHRFEMPSGLLRGSWGVRSRISGKQPRVALKTLIWAK